MTRDELISMMQDALAGPEADAPDYLVAYDDAVKLLTAIEAAGLAIVPVEATDEMLSAAWEAMFVEPYDGQSAPMIGARLDAMIEAGRI